MKSFWFDILNNSFKLSSFLKKSSVIREISSVESCIKSSLVANITSKSHLRFGDILLKSM